MTFLFPLHTLGAPWIFVNLITIENNGNSLPTGSLFEGLRDPGNLHRFSSGPAVHGVVITRWLRMWVIEGCQCRQDSDFPFKIRNLQAKKGRLETYFSH